MPGFIMKHPSEGVEPIERVKFYEREFLSFISDTEISPESLVWAWHIWGLSFRAQCEIKGVTPALIHLDNFLNCLDTSSYFDPTTASLSVFAFLLKTVSRRGDIDNDSILLDLPADKIDVAREFCLKMIEVGDDPRLLNEI